jgi:hypothetical protein
VAVEVGCASPGVTTTRRRRTSSHDRAGADCGQMCAIADCKDGLKDGRMDTFQWLTCRIATIQKAEEFFGDTRNLKN